MPLEPKYYEEFQYTSQGMIGDLLFKRQKKQALEQSLEGVLEKYERFKSPYFVNFLHLGRNQSGENSGDGQHRPSFANVDLFHHVLTRLGFSELAEYPKLTIKLILSTDFSFDYANFARQVQNHIKDDLRHSLHSWISEYGPRFRRELPLFLFYWWKHGPKDPEITFNFMAEKNIEAPLVVPDVFTKIEQWCERIYLDIRITRFRNTLERFNPDSYLNIYTIDSMNGYEFEEFLVELFTRLGYDVEPTRKGADQGADLFVERFGRRIVIQAKNYKDNVGNSAVQQAHAAKTFYECDDAMVITNSYFTPSAKELAANTQIRLVDRDELSNYIDQYNQVTIEAQNQT